MLKNYFTIAIRNLFKNKVYSGINIIGMAIGLACCLTIGLFIRDELSYDRFHTHGENIYRVVEKQVQANNVYDVAVTPGPLAAALKKDFAEVEQTCHVGFKRPAFLEYNGTTAETNSLLVTDSSLFRMFNFTLLRGDARKALTNPDEVVVSETMADKMFGPSWRHDGNLPAGGILLNNNKTLKLAGIAKDPPVNSHIQFEVLRSFSNDDLKPERYHWDNNDYHTYIRLNPGANADRLGTHLFKYVNNYLPNTEVTLSLQPLYDIYLHSNFAFTTEWNKTSSIIYIKIFTAVGLIVLLIAIFNFINLSTARAIQRAREVGVRKAIGAFRMQLVVQFISESLFMTLIAVAIAVVLLQAFLPLMNHISGKQIVIPANNFLFWLAITGFTILVSLLAGIYPAFYLSGFKPDKVLKGVFNIHGGRFFRRTLVVGQFMFSIILIIGALVIYKQLTFLQNKDLGFDKSHLLTVKLKNALRKKTSLLITDLQKQPDIASASASSMNLMDVTNSTSTFKWDGQLPDDEFIMTQANIDPGFLTTTGMKIIAGRNFDASIVTDTASAYLVNETAAKRMGWTPEQALNKSITLWDRPGKIIGVLKDFHFRPLTTTIEPFLFHYWPNDPCNTLFVKTTAGKTRQAIAVIEQFYKKYEKQTAPYYEFVDQTLNNQYQAQQRTGSVVLYFSVLAILVSCLGLFGLVTFTASQRIKEIGIRKVIGASVNHIVLLLTKDFLKLVIIAIVIASPLAWLFANWWLQDFAYRTNVNWEIFIIAGSAVVFIALITVSFQSIKAALANPVKALRSE